MTRITRYQGAIIRDHHILLIQQTEHASGRSYWLLPGGGIEPDETEEDCVQREMWEETGLHVHVQCLLLDEPVAGMRRGEAATVADLVRSLVREGITILLIEHNMSFVMSLCSRITVLDFGRVLTTGNPSEVRACREVVEAYLGAGVPHA